MDYPSTTQALFALIVMIIVLVFILVYCCWGTFSCHREDDMMGAEGGGVPGAPTERGSPGGTALVILPYHNMIYIGDGQTQQVYQIPIREDKPPPYAEIFGNLPPAYNSRSTLDGSEQPPTYEECFRNINGLKVSTSQLHLSSNELNASSSSSVHSPPSAVVSKQFILSALNLRKNPVSRVFRARSLLTMAPSTSSSASPQGRPQINVLSVTPTHSSSSNPNILSCDFVPSFNSLASSNPCISTTSTHTKGS